MKALVYIVGAGDAHRAYASMAVQSLVFSGYAGDVLLVTDAGVAVPNVPAGRVTNTVVPAATGAWAAKRLKATAGLTHGLDGYDVVGMFDADCLFASDPTPLLTRAVANPGKVYLPRTSGRRIGAVKPFQSLLTADELAGAAANAMVDSYAFALAVTSANVQLLTSWDAVNGNVIAGSRWLSDAIGLNVTLVRAGRLADVVFMEECQRLNGPPAPGTLVEHYVQGQAAAVMGKAFAFRMLQPWLAAQAAAEPPTEAQA